MPPPECPSHSTENTDAKEALKRTECKLLLLLLLSGIVLFVVHHSGLAALLIQLQQLQQLIRHSGPLGGVVYILLFVIAAVCLIPGSLLVIAGGLLFGPLYGTLLSVLASTLACAISFLLARWLGRRALVRAVGHTATFQAIERGIAHGGLDFLLLTRLIPLFPYNIQNYAYGLTSIAFWPFVLISAITTLPGLLIYTLMASSLATQGITWLFTLELSLAGLALFALVQLAKSWARHRGIDIVRLTRAETAERGPQ